MAGLQLGGQPEVGDPGGLVSRGRWEAASGYAVAEPAKFLQTVAMEADLGSSWHLAG